MPTAIVATKYDQFEKMEPEYKKIIAKTLRFVAHYYGTALIVISFFFSVIQISTYIIIYLISNDISSQVAKTKSHQSI